MNRDAERQPIPRLRVAVVAVFALGALSLLVLGVNQLRHPLTVDPVSHVPDADPREPTICPSAVEDAVPRVTSNDLYACPRVYDGAVVAYEGEVIGAVLPRSHGAWAQLNDDAYAGDLGPLPAHGDFRGGNAGLGVHLPRSLAEEVTWVGGPTARGDVLDVTGTFHRVDSDSGEVAVLRVDEGSVIRRGQPIEAVVLADRRIVGSVAALATLALLIAETIVRRRRLRR